MFKPKFISNAHLSQRTKYLQTLLIEYEQKEDLIIKEQILANFANFCYDPLNYDIVRQLNIIDLFLDNLDESHEKLVLYSIAGLCNLSFDPLNCQTIVKNEGIKLIQLCLKSNNEEIIIAALSTFIGIYVLFKREELKMQTLAMIKETLSNSSSLRIKNLIAMLNFYRT